MRPRIFAKLLGLAAQFFRLSGSPNRSATPAIRDFAAKTYACTSQSAMGPSARLAVGVKDRIMGVFPSLLRKSPFRLAGILDEPIADLYRRKESIQ